MGNLVEAFEELVRELRWRTRRVQVVALVGRAGTGKSFRARLVAERMGIDLIIDDGLLIRGSRIVAGWSAKKAANRTSATKCSIFLEEAHRREVRAALRRQPAEAILLLGISDKMISRICAALDLPAPRETLRIEDIATRDEIASALKNRFAKGRHVIPVPVIEVKRDPATRLLWPVRLWLGRKRTARGLEQTIVHPAFGSHGRLAISEAALTQMILHCVREVDKDAQVRKVSVDFSGGMLKIEVRLRFTFGSVLPERLAMLQRFSRRNIEHFTGVSLDSFDLVLDGLSSPRGGAARERGQDGSAPSWVRALISMFL